ncbi:MAG: hypothetical protein ACTHMC_22270 [Pseudobacter sp.]|uniref:hypothetical protein n=1 Tax=Pseudobacter sp. TaxID=2045420 RepID=UPI003F7CEF75
MNGQTKVYTWQEAISAGCDPLQYSYLPGIIPASTLIARLDFKIWSNKVIGIDGYFTLILPMQKFQLTVHPTARYGYRTGEGLIDFHACCTHQMYLLELKQVSSGRWNLKNICCVEQQG